MNRAPLTPWKFGEPIDAWLYPELQVKLAELIAKHSIRTVLEIGTCYGCSAIWFAQRVKNVVCVDTWDDIPEHGLVDVYPAFVSNMLAAGVNIGTIIANSHDPRFRRFGTKVDLVYLDGDHTYEGVKQDIEMYGPIARKVLCGDDYDRELPSVAGVIRAVDELVPEREVHGRFWYKEIV